jgi:hypothetical protein
MLLVKLMIISFDVKIIFTFRYTSALLIDFVKGKKSLYLKRKNRDDNRYKKDHLHSLRTVLKHGFQMIEKPQVL